MPTRLKKRSRKYVKKTSTLRLLLLISSFLVVIIIGFVLYHNRANNFLARAVSLPIDDTSIERSIYLLNFNPIIESAGGVKLTEYKQWNDPDQITNALIPLFPQVSNSYVSYRIQERQEVDGIYVKPDGYQYTDESYLACIDRTGPCHSPDIIDYQRLFNDYNICSKNVDEVWLWGGPYFGYFEYNPVAYCGRTTFVMGFNYERGMGEALHNFGHRMEFVGINRVGDGNWQQNEANEWNKFSLIDGHCGNIHYPPGTIVGSEEYMYNKATSVNSDCEGYLSYPTGPFPVQSLTCNSWGCSQEGYVQWWLNHIPHNTSTTVINGKTLYNNWWKYYVYFDETFEPVPTAIPGTFSNLSATLPIPGSAVFNFDYSSTSPNYIIDISTYPDMSWDTYLTFAQGPSSPVTESNPTKWDKYSCGRTLYWRVKTTTGVQSDIQSATVTCITPESSPTPTSSITTTPTFTPTPLPSPTPTPVELLQNPGFEIDGNGDGRPDNWTTNNKFTRNATSVHSGAFAGRHYSASNTTYNVNQTVGNIIGNASYSFSAWTNIPATSDSFTYKLQLRWRNAGGSVIRTETVKTYSSATGGWDQVISTRVAPSDARSVVVRMSFSSLKATIYVDDFSLIKL
ncbi:hypothetical protein A3C25_02180 [Candidatus Roizmanbacteria bacterium RIFCSPHIGHO2_02_FULL_38_11]|uniref:CBM-cenC domain-containing protein n=1 Tax=Candidatus Roizmanbacteria bacterium RIFCSPHIGHO2_02_FULL_38_11 TaxID=1802039 RepID=A0A1F7GX44_9BACT|nr:MAG: hypothetical protein A3C25_02180 [Candidatus Roizmanbacteria bacterium RIFCSPHIGHO2_02_FULL_38_11]